MLFVSVLFVARIVHDDVGTERSESFGDGLPDAAPNWQSEQLFGVKLAWPLLVLSMSSWPRMRPYSTRPGLLEGAVMLTSSWQLHR